MPLPNGNKFSLMYYSLCIFGRIDDFDISVCESVMRPPPEMFKKPLLNKYISVSHQLNLFYSSFFLCLVFSELSSKWSVIKSKRELDIKCKKALKPNQPIHLPNTSDSPSGHGLGV